MKKILLNLTSIKKGGAIQFTNSILHNLEFLDAFNISILYFDNQKKVLNIPNDKNLIEIKYTTKFKTIITLNSLDYDEFDYVYTIFGPSYIYKIRKKHCVGFALGWTLINKNHEAYKTLSPIKRVLKKLENQIKLYLILMEAERFTVETELVKKKLVEKTGIPPNKINILSNTSQFKKSHIDNDININYDVVFYAASYYPHKNHELIFRVAKEFPDKRFYVTIDNKTWWKLKNSTSSNVINLGYLNRNQLLDVYALKPICFIPSLLESFSASYVEAMAFELPIIAPNRDFVHDICGNTPYYYNNELECISNFKNLKLFWENESQIKLSYRKQLQKFGDEIDRIKHLEKILKSLT